MLNQQADSSQRPLTPFAPAALVWRGIALICLFLVCVPGTVVFAAPYTIRDGGVDPANLGKGEWIFSLKDATNKLSGHISSVTNENSLMLYFKNQGIRWVIVKAGTAEHLYYGCYPTPQFSSGLVNAAHDNGLFIFGDTRSYGSNIVGEIAVADYCFNNGADGFVWDAEQEWEPSGHAWITNGPLQAWWLCGTTRTNWPNKFLAHSPQAIISVHTAFPYKEFGYWCDAVMPMVYHFNPTYSPGFTNSVSQAMEYMDANWGYWQNQWTNMSSVINGETFYFSNSIIPIVPMQDVYGTGSSTICEGSASAQTRKDVMEFIDYAAADPNRAAAGGYQGVDFFRCDLHDTTQWGSIRAGTSGSFPGIVNNVVLDDRTTTKSGTWTKVLTFYAATPTPNKINFQGCGSLTDTNSFGTNYWTKAKGTGSAYRQFTPNILVPGDYNVYQWHPNVTNASASVPHIVTHALGTTTVNANQQTNAGLWSLLGRFNFAAGSAGSVRVTDGIPEDNALVIVDGLKLVFVASNTVSLTLTSAPNPAVYGDAVTLTATATSSLGTPSGTVTFYDGAITLGSPTLNGAGQAIFTTNRLSVAGSPHSLTAVYAGTGPYNTCGSSAISQTITPTALIVTGLAAQDKTYDGTTNATLVGAPALSGALAGDDVSLAGTPTGAFADKTVETGKTVNVTGLSLSGAAAGNYTLTPPALSADITAAALTATGITADNKTYDGTTGAAIHTDAATLATVVSGDAVTLEVAGATGAFADPEVGWNKLVNITGLSITGADAGNYLLTQPATTTADIRPTTPPSVGRIEYDAGSGTFHAWFAGYPNFRYRIETATSIAGPWTFLQNVTAGSEGEFEVVETRWPPEQTRYYRTLYP